MSIDPMLLHEPNGTPPSPLTFASSSDQPSTKARQRLLRVHIHTEASATFEEHVEPITGKNCELRVQLVNSLEYT